jgi:hypothetical protein
VDVALRDHDAHSWALSAEGGIRPTLQRGFRSADDALPFPISSAAFGGGGNGKKGIVEAPLDLRGMNART